jgi:hypothetical protein
LRSSISNRAALLATAAALLLPCGAAVAQPHASALIEGVLFGAAEPAGARGDPFGELLLGVTASAPAPRAPPPDPPRPALIRVAAPAPTRPVKLAALPPTRDVLGRLLLAEAAPPAGPQVARGPPRPAGDFPPPDKDTLLLLMVQLDDLTLSDGLAAYGQPEDPLLPLGELSRLLELDVDVSPSDGRVTGRLGEARRALLIDLVNRIARVGPQEVPIGPGDVAVDPTEIYVRASTLMKLLPVRFQVDPRALSMKITALELLPIQGRLQRLARIRQGQTGPGAARAERVPSPYHLFTPPSADVALDFAAQGENPRLPFRYDVRVGGDVGYMGLQAYVGSDEETRATTSRVLLERRSYEGDLLGPLHARDIGLGDVFTPSLPIGPRSFGGRGVELSTVPLDQTTVFNRVDLRGELPLGDDVELYVNDVLQGAQSQATRGQYEFLNVPLTQGINIVRIVTYGPHGERNEETRIINGSGGLLHPGQTTFEFAAVEQETPVIRFGGFDPDLNDPAFGKRRIVGAVSYGIAQFLTATAGGAIYTDRLGVERQLGTVGLRTSIGGYALGGDYVEDRSGANGADVTLAGRVLGVNAVLRHAEYRGGLLDENNDEADLSRPVRRRTELTLDDNLAFGQRLVPLSLRGVYDDYADGGSAWIGQLRGSATLGPVLYSSGLEYDRLTAANGQLSERLRGFVAGSTFRSYKWQIRATVDYDAVPDLRLSDLIITADRALNDRWALRFGVTERLDEPKGTELIASSTTRTKFGDLAITGLYDTNHNVWRIGAQLNFGIGYNPARRGYELTREGPGSGGSVVFHAFIDSNGNGVYDPGEKPVAGVVLEGGDQKVRTDGEGRAYLSGFGSGPTARIVVGLSELDNPQVRSPPTVVEFTPRPGGVTEIEYPLRPTGEVMVNVKLRRADVGLVGLSATRIRLLDAKGGPPVEGVTEFDGSVNFQDLPAGTYRVELDPEQAQRLRMRLAAPVSITIRPDGGITPDANVVVEFEPKPDA